MLLPIPSTFLKGVRNRNLGPRSGCPLYTGGGTGMRHFEQSQYARLNLARDQFTSH